MFSSRADVAMSQSILVWRSLASVNNGPTSTLLECQSKMKITDTKEMENTRETENIMTLKAMLRKTKGGRILRLDQVESDT